MIVSYSQLIGNDILSIDEQKSAGRVADLVIQKTDLKIKAALVGKHFFWLPQKAVIFDDIVDINQSALVVQNSENIIRLKELLAIQKAIQSKCLGINQKVITKSGSAVGIVYDYTFDSTSGLLYSLHVKKFLTDKIIPRSIIVEYNNNIFIIDDDYELVKNTNTVPETA